MSLTEAGNVPAATLIVIHGVGDAEPGANLRAVAAGLLPAGTPATRRDLVIDDTLYPSLTVEHPDVSRIIEVNWSDVAQPLGAGGHTNYWRIRELWKQVLAHPAVTWSEPRLRIPS